MKMDAIGAKGLDIPGRHSTSEGAFHMKMARAKGGLVHDGNKWTGMKLPERHMDVQREAYLRRGVNLPAPRETGEVNDVPPHLLRSKIVAEVKRHRANGNGKPMRVLVLFAGGGGASEGWRHVNGARTVCAVEMNGDAATVYSANHDHPVLQLNIADWVGVALALKQHGPFDLVQWSPPCQPHSNANANKICNDPRETVMLAAARLIKALDVPHFVMENVVGVKSSPVWLSAKSFLAQAGYKTLELVVNANHCGVPQNRERLFAVGSKVVTTEIWKSLASQALDFAALGPDTVARAQEFGGHRRPVVRDSVIGVKDSYWLRDRGSGPCVRDSTMPAPTILTTCTGRPGIKTVARARASRGVKRRRTRRRYNYTRRTKDAGSVKDASILKVCEVGVIQGFPYTYRWNAVSRTTAGRLIGNAVPPLVMRTVGRWLLHAGFRPRAGDVSSPCVLKRNEQEMLDPACTSIRARVSRPSGLPEAVTNEISMSTSALITLQRRSPKVVGLMSLWLKASTECASTVKAGRLVLPYWALSKPRTMQSPLMEEWRQKQLKSGVEPDSAEMEEAAGMGSRNTKVDNRPLLLEDEVLVERVLARIAARRAYTGLLRTITGRPNQCWREWKRSGAPDNIVEWLRDGGYRFDFNGEVPPTGLGGKKGDGNNPGVHNPNYAAWLHRTIEELCVLGVIEEVKHRPYVCCPMGVVEKSGYNAQTNPNRLRLILDQRALNDWLDAPKYSHESLEKARDIFEEDDCILTTDIRQGYWHGLAHPSAKEFMGCQLGGRYFVWRATPMGCCTSAYVFQASQWVLSKKFRRLGIRLVNYSDDYAFLVKRKDAKLVAAYIQAEFEAHGLELNVEKSEFEPQREAVVLGVGINLDKQIFFITDKKKTKIVRGIRELLAANRRSGGIGESSARLLAKTVGRIMALHVVCGNVVRRLTRDCYRLIALATDVDPDAPRKHIKVAWDTTLVLNTLAISELKFWLATIPSHEGSRIWQQGPIPTVRLSTDAGEEAWAGILDEGDGTRRVARSTFSGHECGSASTQAVFGTTGTSSTRRELLGLLEAMKSFRDFLTQKTVVVYGDNQSAIRILEIGSKRADLQEIAIQIFRFAMEFTITIVPRWLRRCHLQEEDDGSKFTDECDYRLSDETFEEIKQFMGVGAYTHDRFATSTNRRAGMKYNSRFFSPGTDGVDAFTQHWGGGDDNWLYPPFSLIGKTIRHLQFCKGRGTLLVPLDTRRTWWPLVAAGAGGTVWRRGAPLRLEISPDEGLLTAGNGAEVPAGGPLIAVRLDFRSHSGATSPGLHSRVAKAALSLYERCYARTN